MKNLNLITKAFFIFGWLQLITLLILLGFGCAAYVLFVSPLVLASIYATWQYFKVVLKLNRK